MKKAILDTYGFILLLLYLIVIFSYLITGHEPNDFFKFLIITGLLVTIKFSNTKTEL
jgi:cell division protein FtsW (lipid II flippase)